MHSMMKRVWDWDQHKENLCFPGSVTYKLYDRYIAHREGKGHFGPQ